MVAFYPGVQYARLDTGDVPDHLEHGKQYLAKCRLALQLQEHQVRSCHIS